MAFNKHTLASLFRVLRLDTLGLALQRARFSPFVRAVNYHDVPPERADDFDRQLAFYAENFESLDLEGLLDLQAGRWAGERPGIILTFDDGLRSHADVVAPLLERHGMVGWFMVPVAFVDAAPEEQAAFALDHSIGHAKHDYGDPRIALSWNDVRDLSRRHVIGCHTRNHTRLAASLGDEELVDEIPRAKQRLESELSQEVPVFAWVGGEEWSYSRRAAESIQQAGFRVGFMTNNQVIRPGCDLLQLQRTNVEARDSDAVVGLQLSGLLDVLYLRKRNRVNSLTHVAAS